jgi:ribosomal protein S20
MTMSRLRLAGFAGLLVVAALVGGTIIGSVAAATAPPTVGSTPAALAAPTASDSAAGARAAAACATFRKAFAANLGVDESALVPAAKAAADATIDAAVGAGTITSAKGDRLKARVDAADGQDCALLAGRIARIGARAAGAGPGVKAALGVAKDGLIAAAKALGITPAELGGRLRGGETLKDVATSRGVAYDTVSAAVVTAVKADLDAAVAAGTIKRARADRILARIGANLADGRLHNARPVAPAGSSAPTSGG